MKPFKPMRALGAMSGTSLDGVDAAVVVTDGVAIAGFGDSAYLPYSQADEAVLRAALGKWQGEDLGPVPELIETRHAKALAHFKDIDLIGFHGQTLAHDPSTGRTHQCGDGQVLADVLQTPVVWDFRSADMELGGQGAPLAPFYHHALARHLKLQSPVAFLNLGGVGNLTYVDPRIDQPEADGALLAFDTGPANAPINDLMMARRGDGFDEGGALARKGGVSDDIVAEFLTSPYFLKMPPKSLDRNDFGDMMELVQGLSDADAAATLTAIAALSAVAGLDHCPTVPMRVLVTGGGRKNTVLMEMLSVAADCTVEPVEDVGLDGDMLEAQAFAYLAVRVLRGLPTSCHSTTGVRAAVAGGIISRPR